MPPKRRSTGPAAKSQQSTLAFHGASNKVTKPGTRAANAKKNILAEPVKKEEKPEATDVQVKEEEEEEEPTTAEAAIIEQTEQVQQQTQSTPEEDEARRITKKRIEAYWKKEISGDKAPRAHQQGLSLEEKILRKFDMSGQYGPCVGIARLKRWQRAHRLGLEPPIEVLAVLLKEQEGKDKLAVQRSHVDELLNARADTELQV
ncbi:hypothetical protein K458DRAFT_413176 [Lentithecium fluviatile CBS 122367]|uniref:DNA polymerase delta subunit 4 n=1 Tax=Lentithecium fluviatile CBS 122367 TaxID=1168545 RepID=A0A6G1JJS0_9PLEO|nr:hypothetical protein K458DRAFT_413176 [Lentithecium fluviatile CBS 122367]